LQSCGFGYQSQDGNVLSTVFAPRSREGDHHIAVRELFQLIDGFFMQLVRLLSCHETLFERFLQAVNVLAY
jgi:hypothetical protein